jgi:uncharacterized protein YciI
MPLFCLIGRDGPRGLELRKQHRGAHLDNMEPLEKAGRLSYAGPLLGDDGEPCGSVIVFEAPDLASAREFGAADPYVTGGVFGEWEVLGTRQIFPKHP